MVLLEQYITLYEKRWQNVFLGWKYFQITIYFITAIFGILASFCWTRINFSFDNNCILYGNVTFNTKTDPTDKGATEVNKDLSHFGKDVFCSYCQYVPVCSVLFAALWMTFFTMCGRGGRSDHGLPQPWRIVYPAMTFNIVSFLFSLIAVVWYEDGYARFCKLFVDNNGKTDCKDLEDFTLTETSGKETVFYFTLARVGTWGIMFGWLLGAILLLLRCCFLADFTVMKITVVGATPVEEEKQQYLLQAPKASPESTNLSPEENPSATLNVPPVL